ncbi:MAG: penicillin-binding protein 2 [Deltaproteobacteria bacterium]|nr:penicillin-binding protein 2 [Deltaproteobacteria bacterium]
MIFVLPFFIILAARLFYLQVLNGESFLKTSENNFLRRLVIDPMRGMIFDRSGRLVVDNRPSFDLEIIPKDAKNIGLVAECLSRFIPLSKTDILQKIKKQSGLYGFRPVLIKKDIGRDLMGVILSHRLQMPGVRIHVAACRQYVYDGLAAHLIGYLGEINARELADGRYPEKRPGDFVGRRGIEKVFERLLSGKPGSRMVQVDATGQVVHELRRRPQKAGDNVFLTIDLNLQQEAAALLSDKTGAIVAMDPENGEILAMASSPAFDQNAFVSGLSSDQWKTLSSDPRRPLQDKAVQGLYPPASTYKIITAMAALEEGICDTKKRIFCPGYYKFGNRNYRCWKAQGHGYMNIIDAITQSCDVFFYHMGKDLGVDRLAWYARACGLGSKTGIVLEHESSGLVPTAEWKKRRTNISWQAGETLSVAIGQGANLVTPIQMAVLISAIANGGTLFRPRIVRTVESAGGVIVKETEPGIKGRIPASPETIEVIKEGLKKVVNGKGGTGYWHVRSKQVVICGKTGTAQVRSRKTGEESAEGKNQGLTQPHAWFIGYAPENKPRIAVAVLIEHGGHGSSSAGPVARQVILSYLKNQKQETAAKEGG